MNILTEAEKEELFSDLLYLKMKELKNLCERLGISSKGEKGVLIENIKYYISTGKKPEIRKIPAISKAKSKIFYPLTPDTPMLYGSFKNDLKTRMFLKSLIGNHFHYTSYGLDWLKERWFNGNPPTYAEFAHYWQEEYLARKKKKGALKPEWAYLNFLDRYKQENPAASKIDAINAWKKYREIHVVKVQSIIDRIIK